MTRPKPKTVRAWAFAVRNRAGESFIPELTHTKADALALLARFMSYGCDCGPVVRIEVPAPKERKR